MGEYPPNLKTKSIVIWSLSLALFVKIVVFNTKPFKVDWSSGTGETPQAFSPRRLNTRPTESEHLEGKSTTPHYLVISNKVCENSLKFLSFRFIQLFHVGKDIIHFIPRIN